MSKLYIIAGCNGAGKTTASYTVLPEILECREFVNADEIAKGLSPFNPSSVAIEAGRLMLKRIGELLSAGVSFSVETTLSTRSYINLIQQAQNQGYSVSLIYFWLNSPELAIERVKQRVANGGHDVLIVRNHLECSGYLHLEPSLHTLVTEVLFLRSDRSNFPSRVVHPCLRDACPFRRVAYVTRRYCAPSPHLSSSNTREYPLT